MRPGPIILDREPGRAPALHDAIRPSAPGDPSSAGVALRAGIGLAIPREERVAKKQLLINYVPGEECRVAVVADGRLEDLHTERANAVSHVGNIYVGKVTNVEAGIQAAFINFGLEHNGFLHISDLHPQYFPGEDDETTEQVGKKTPRRERPPIQRALKRGQEIMVQVIKEGIGTKGPTLTSYLSIPGRYLVMMPAMDRVGVSRKIEDDELRRKMRDQLDQLDLPDGFGFILRTAGMERNKTELKRDLSYLNRLWQDMERLRKSGGGPRLLYAESDLLLRALRDMLSSDIDEIIIDDESALRRASRFLKIFAPRSAPKLLHYDSHVPIYHAYGVEEQIQAMNSRRVELPSGGYLVIDETEALVAIDVNSGKMRSHGDAETTAFRTNQEAVDEICRQMRLRDLGGLVVLDLIDMRSRSHRRDIETQLRNNLKKDAARSKALAISQFGMIELTRQRMHGSMRSTHFAPCPECDGRGLVQRPDSVAGAAMRELAALLAHDRVRKVEMVVSPRVASEMLTNKRRNVTRLEMRADKEVHVRVSETIAIDRVTYYAYDDRGADVDIARLPRLKPETSPQEWSESAKQPIVDPLEEERRLMREIDERAEAEAEPQIEAELHPLEMSDDERDEESADGQPRKRKRRRRRRRRKSGEGADTNDATEDSSAETPSKASSQSDDESADDESDGQPKRKKRRRRRRRKSGDASPQESEAASDTPDSSSNGQARPERAPQTKPEPKPEPEPAAKSGGASSRFAPRGDSWDVEPAAVKPLPPPGRAKKAAQEKPEVVMVDEPEPEPAPAPAPPVASEPDEPEETTEDADKKPAARKKRSRSKKTTKKKAATRKKTATSAKKKTKRASRKKAPSGASADSAKE